MLGGGVDAATLVCSHLPGCLFTACVWARGQTGGWRAVICSQHLCSSVHTSLVACSQRLFGREAILAVGEQLFVHNTFVPLFTPPWLSVHSVCLGARPIGGWRAAICSQHLCSSVHTSLVACLQRVFGREANWRLASSARDALAAMLVGGTRACGPTNTGGGARREEPNTGGLTSRREDSGLRREESNTGGGACTSSPPSAPHLSLTPSEASSLSISAQSVSAHAILVRYSVSPSGSATLPSS